MDNNQTSVSEPRLIDLRNFEDLNYWAQRLGVSRERIIRAVHTVGPMCWDVQREVAETD